MSRACESCAVRETILASLSSNSARRRLVSWSSFSSLSEWLCCIHSRSSCAARREDRRAWSRSIGKEACWSRSSDCLRSTRSARILSLSSRSRASSEYIFSISRSFSRFSVLSCSNWFSNGSIIRAMAAMRVLESNSGRSKSWTGDELCCNCLEAIEEGDF